MVSQRKYNIFRIYESDGRIYSSYELRSAAASAKTAQFLIIPGARVRNISHPTFYYKTSKRKTFRYSTEGLAGSILESKLSFFVTVDKLQRGNLLFL